MKAAFVFYGSGPDDAEDLARMLRRVTLDGPLFDTMGDAAREAYETRYSGERAYELLQIERPM